MILYFTNNIELILSMLKPFEIKNFLSLSYQTLGSYLRPYKVFLSLKYSLENYGF